MTTTQHNTDALLRDTACAQNAALPFALWKQNMLQAVAQLDEGQSEEYTPPDELAVRRTQAARKRKQFTLGFATAAAALLVFFGARALIPGLNYNAEAPMATSDLGGTPAALKDSNESGAGQPFAGAYDTAPSTAPADELAQLAPGANVPAPQTNITAPDALVPMPETESGPFLMITEESIAGESALVLLPEEEQAAISIAAAILSPQDGIGSRTQEDMPYETAIATLMHDMTYRYRAPGATTVEEAFFEDVVVVTFALEDGQSVVCLVQYSPQRLTDGTAAIIGELME